MDIGLPPWREKDDGYLLMKFFETEDYLKDFLNGKIYFNTPDYFTKIENVGQADDDEGKEIIISQECSNNIAMNFENHNGKTYAVVRDYSSCPEEYKPGTIISYSPAKNRYRKIVCFYSAYLNSNEQRIDISSRDMVSSFGKYAVVIPDRQLFFERLVDGINKQKNIIEAQIGFVEYVEAEQMNGLINWGPFKKNYEKFYWQNELRATFINDTRDPVKLDLEKDLRDLAFPIMEGDFGEIFLTKEGLLYPIYEEKI